MSADDRVEALCQRYNYLTELCEVLEQLAEAAQAAYPKLHSFILCGSIATGDFVWRRGATGSEFRSDIDAFLFAEPAGVQPEGLKQCIASLEKQYASPLFHIDVSVSPPSALRQLPTTYRMPETRQSGVVLLGADVREAPPVISKPARLARPFRQPVETRALCTARRCAAKRRVSTSAGSFLSRCALADLFRSGSLRRRPSRTRGALPSRRSDKPALPTSAGGSDGLGQQDPREPAQNSGPWPSRVFEVCDQVARALYGGLRSPSLEPHLAIDTIHPLLIDLPALSPKQAMQTPVAESTSLRGRLPKLLSKLIEGNA